MPSETLVKIMCLLYYVSNMDGVQKSLKYFKCDAEVNAGIGMWYY